MLYMFAGMAAAPLLVMFAWQWRQACVERARIREEAQWRHWKFSLL